MELIEHERRRYASKGLFVIPGVILLLSFGFVGYLINPIYQKMFTTYGETPTFIALVLLVHHMTYIGNGLMNIGMGKIQYFAKYKTNPGEWPWKSDYELIRRTTKTLALNFIVIIPAYLMVSRGLGNVGPKFDLTTPTFIDNVKWIPFTALIESLAIYVMHSLLHTPWLYKHVHKQHHEYTVTIGIAAEYAHPLEFLFVNIFAATLGLLFIGKRIHFVSYLVMLFFRVNHAMENHSGFDLPWSPYTALPLTCNV